MADIQELARQLWQREGGHCVSHLVATLAQGSGDIGGWPELKSLEDLTLQAFELSCPIDDWESAAREEGWTDDYAVAEPLALTAGYTTVGLAPNLKINPHYGNDDNGMSEAYDGDWQGLCGWAGIEPHQREVFEHWIVSDWLADKLAEKGEKVDKDFAGLTIWARTTTGQAVYADHVIEQIAADLAA